MRKFSLFVDRNPEIGLLLDESDKHVLYCDLKKWISIADEVLPIDETRYHFKRIMEFYE